MNILSASRLVHRRSLGNYESGQHPGPAAGPAFGLAGWALSLVTVRGCALTDDRVVALTYDDGPHPRHTPQVLDALDRAGARATFFLLTDSARALPDLAREILARGHEVGLHGDDHTRVSSLDWRTARGRVRAARHTLEDIVQAPIGLYRPAYGALTRSQLVAVRALGLDVVLWSAWARDWEDDSAQVLAARAGAAVHPGAILLLHDASEGLLPTGPAGTDEPAHLPGFSRGELTRLLLADLERRGYRTMTVSELRSAAPQARMLWGESRAAAREALGGMIPVA